MGDSGMGLNHGLSALQDNKVVGTFIFAYPPFPYLPTDALPADSRTRAAPAKANSSISVHQSYLHQSLVPPWGGNLPPCLWPPPLPSPVLQLLLFRSSDWRVVFLGSVAPFLVCYDPNKRTRGLGMEPSHDIRRPDWGDHCYTPTRLDHEPANGN